jgi:hypothetical protein
MAEKRKSRDGHARKPAQDKPATFESLEEESRAGGNGANGAFDAKTVAQRLEIWRLNTKDGTYFMPMKSGEDWREIGERELRRSLKDEGVRQKAGEDERLSEAERVFEYVSNFRTVDFNGPLAGHKAGVHYSKEGLPFIVKGGPKLIVPKKGDASLIWQILKPRFEDEEGPQLDYFLLWLRRGVEPLYNGTRRKGPMLILTGPNDCGKSFIQDHIITPIFGGRYFDPTDFFKNDSGFNKHMMASEHLAIGEFAFPLDGASRLMISEKFKKIVANDGQTYHPKGKDAMTMHPHFRLSISINDNPEKLRALPPMNSDLSDKVLLLRVRGGVAMPMPTNSDMEEAAFAAAVRKALPAFVHELLSWTPPEDIATGRFGMQVWQHPEIVDSLWEQEPGARFAFLLDKELFPQEERATWQHWGWGKAVQLHEEMTGDQSKHAKQFASVAKHEGAFTQMLGLLFKKESEALARERRKKPDEIEWEGIGRRYWKRHTKNGNFWQIHPPA